MKLDITVSVNRLSLKKRYRSNIVCAAFVPPRNGTGQPEEYQ